MKPLLVQRSARTEFREATAWYRERNVEVADRFVAEVERTLHLIRNFPRTGARIPLVLGPARRLPVTDFPPITSYSRSSPIASKCSRLLTTGGGLATGETAVDVADRLANVELGDLWVFDNNRV